MARSYKRDLRGRFSATGRVSKLRTPTKRTRRKNNRKRIVRNTGRYLVGAPVQKKRGPKRKRTR